MRPHPRQVPPTTMNDLLDGPAPLLDVTFDQLRTLLAVRETGAPLPAARLLDREHSSVRKQLWTVPGLVDSGISCPIRREIWEWVQRGVASPRSTRSRR